MSAAEARDRHLRHLEELTAPGGPIGTDAPTATHRQPGNLLGGRLSPARARLHKEILREFFAENPDVLRDRKAVVTAGPPGAGKSSALHDLVPAAEERLWRSIDPDEFKRRLLRYARDTGQYEALVPDRARELICGGEVFAPGEFAALVHEESSDLAKIAAAQSIARGERVILDGVHGSADKILARIGRLAEAGYTAIDVVCVDGPREATRARVLARWEKGYERYQSSGGTDESAGYRTRYVPETVTDALYADDDRFSSCAQAVAEATRAAPAGMAVHSEVYYVDSPAAAPKPWKSYHKDDAGFTHHSRRHIPLPSPPALGGSSAPSSAAPAISGEVYVAGYQRADGSWVSPHTRTRPAK